MLRGPKGQGQLMVADMDLKMSASSQRQLAVLASKNAASISTLLQTGPLFCGILGLMLILAATIPFRRHWRVAFGRRGSAGGELPKPGDVHKSGYTKAMNDDDSRMNVRDVRAHLAEVLTRAQNGSPTVIMRNGDPVAAVVPIEDFNVLEDAIDRYFSREADRDLADNPDAPTYSMSEVVAAIFEESAGQGAA